jgi:Protein of unknown function (DUF3187)
VPGASAGEFFAVRDENPLLRGLYLPLPADGRGSDTSTLAATVSLSNTLNVENRGSESLLVDGESTTLRVAYEGALTSAWHVRFTLPLIHDSGGSFDTLIDDYHRAFGFNRGYRPDYPKGEIAYRYQGLSHLQVDRSGTSIGDVAGELGWYALDDAARTLSLWGGLEAPSGSTTRLTSDGAWDGALLVHYAQRLSRWQIGAESGISEPFGDELFEGHAHRLSAFGRFALGRLLGSAWTVRAQLDAQTRRVSDSELRLTGPSLQVSLGAARRLARHWQLEFGFTEDAAVNTAPDITFFLGIRRQSRAE